MAAFGHENICRLDIAVNDARRVRRIESIGNVDSKRQQLFQFKRPPTNTMLERHTVQELHRDEGLPVLLANVVNGADVGMIQSRGRLGFALKARQSLRILGDIVGKELQRDEAMQPRVFRLIDHAHAAAVEPFDNTVVRDSLVDHARRINSGLQS